MYTCTVTVTNNKSFFFFKLQPASLHIVNKSTTLYSHSFGTCEEFFL